MEVHAMVYETLSHHTQEAFTKSIVEHDLEKLSVLVENERKSIIKKYQLGLYGGKTYNDLMNGVSAFPNSKLLRHIGLYYGASYTAWLHLQNDWTLWKGKKLLDNSSSNTWLFNEHMEEVAPTEKIFVFKLMDIFKTPIHLFEKCPSNIASPNRRIDHVYADGLSISIPFEEIDDNALLLDLDPIGKKYCIKGKNNVTVFITVTEVVSSDKFQFPDFIGLGHIDGYTSDVERKITVYTNPKSGKIDMLAFFSDFDYDDQTAFMNDTRWQQYFAWGKEYDARLGKEFTEINESYQYTN